MLLANMRSYEGRSTRVFQVASNDLSSVRSKRIRKHELFVHMRVNSSLDYSTKFGQIAMAYSLFNKNLYPPCIYSVLSK